VATGVFWLIESVHPTLSPTPRPPAPGASAPVKRINLKFLLVLITMVVVLLVGVVFLRRFQVSRNAGNLAKLAKQRLDEGKPAEAIQIYARYIGLRPEDNEAYAEYAKLMLARAEAPDATRNDLGRAYNTLEAAVRRNPENDDLRRMLAKFQLRIGRSGDAREHLDILKERIEQGLVKPTSSDEGGKANDLDVAGIELLMARSFLGGGDFAEAGRIVSSMVGFDMERRAFDDEHPKTGPTDAYVILAAILEEKLDDDDAATAVLEKLVEVQSEDVQAWLARSGWHRQRGKLDAAGADIETAMKLDPDNINGIFAAFELALARKDMVAARKHAERGREVAPEDERVYRGLASVAMQEGALPEAEQVLLDGIEKLPGKASLLLMLADTLLQQGKLEQVEQAIARIKELYGTASPAVGLLEGRLLVAQGRWADAKARLEDVRPMVIASPELVRQVDLYLGQCHAQLQEFDAQLDVNRRVLADDPGSLAARAGTAAALASAGKPEEALAEFEAIAAALDPERLGSVPQVWYPLLQLRMQLQARRPVSERDWSAVDALLDTLAESEAVSPDQLSLLRADVLVRKGEPAAARELLEATAAGGENPQVWAALVTLLLRTEGPEAADAALARAPAALAKSAILLTVRGQVAARRSADESKAELAALEQEAMDLTGSDSVNVLTSLAGIQYAAGNPAAAEKLWREVAKRAPDDIRAREAILELLIAQGDLEKAELAADEVAAVAGRGSARARVAEASLRIFEVREAQRKRQETGGDSPLTDEDDRKLNEARNLLTEAETDRPGWGQIQTLFSEIDSIRGNLPAATDRLRKAVELGPTNPVLIRRLVAMLYSLNRLDEAQATLSRLDSGAEQGIERITAEMELRAGNADDAVALAERSVKLDTATPEDLLWLGQMLDRAGKRERAGDVLTQATELAPERSDVWLALFSSQAGAGRKPAARRSLEKASSLLPEPQRQLTLAQGLELLGEIEEAAKTFGDAAAAAPDNLEVQRAYAASLVRAGRTKPARETLQKMIASGEATSAAIATKAWARRLLAELIAERGNFREMQQAMAILRENVDESGEIAIDDALLQVKLLTARPEPASWKQAIAVLEEIARRQPLVMGQRIMMAQLLEKVGRWSEARNELVAVVAAPNVPPAYVAMLVEKLIDHGEIGAVRPWLTRLQKSTPDSAITLALEAKLAIAENDRELAKESARKLMPGGVVSASEPAQLAAVARLMEQLGFPKAADRVLAQFADTSADGVIARAEFLGRQKRIDEALEMLEARWNDLPLERLLTTAVQVVRVQDAPAEMAPRLDRWFTKAKRVDPGSIVIKLLEAEKLSLEGRVADAEVIYRELASAPDIDATQRAVVANNLAFHLARPDSVAEAKTLIESAIEELGPLPDLLDTRGMIRLAAGENSEAVADFEEAVLQPTDVKFLHLAWAQFKAGDQAAAKTSLEAGLRRGLSASKLAPDERARLKELESALGVAEPALDSES
jgi:tetratricopeptide (TPR) repeat protein